jgi:SSS family solute:Na+ symporter
MSSALSVLDYCIVAAYLVGTLAIGLWIGRRLKTGHDFFLAGRSLPWWAVGFSLVATDIGGTDIIGVGGAAYAHGLAVGNFEWIGCIPAMIIAAFVFIPIFWRAGVSTIPEFLERRFDARIRVALAACWLIFMACNIGIMLFASAKMMGVLFGWPVSLSVILTAALVGIYCTTGGLAAVVYTDVLQCVVMIAGCLLVLVLGTIDLGGVSALLEKVRQIETARGATAGAGLEHTALILPVDTKSPFPWTGILFGLTFVLGPAYWIGNQAIVQRALGAKSEFEVKAAYVFGALMKNLIPVIVAIPGLIALAKFPELSEADTAFPTLVSHVLPSGARGLFLAAFLAALMSSVDSYLNSAATLVTTDFYQRFFRRAASDESLLRVGRIATVLLLAWGIGFAFYVAQLEGTGIYAIFQTLMAFFQGPALAVLLAGLLWRRATSTGAFVAFLSGVGMSVALFTLNQEAVYRRLGWEPLFKIAEPYLYFSVWGFITAAAVLCAVSLLTPAESDDKLRGLVFERRPRTTPAAPEKGVVA